MRVVEEAEIWARNARIREERRVGFLAALSWRGRLLVWAWARWPRVTRLFCRSALRRTGLWGRTRVTMTTYKAFGVK